jgi:hypothetical protein
MDVSNWSNESILEEEDKVGDSGDDGKKQKIGFLGGCLIAIGGFFLLLLTICGGMMIVDSNQKYPEVYFANNPGFIELGATQKLDAQFQDTKRVALKWSSSDPAVLTVSKSGEIHGLKSGLATIKAETTKDSLFASTEILVIKTAKSFKLMANKLQLKMGQSVAAGYIAIPADANIYMYSDNASIAGVSGTNIIALAPGTTKIHFVKGISPQHYLMEQTYGEVEVTVSQ